MDLKGRFSACWLLLLLLVCGPVGAFAPVIQVVGPDPVAGEVAGLLAARLPTMNIRRTGGQPALVVAVGARAFQEALASAAGKVPVVGVALTRHSYRTVADRSLGRHTAVYWEPDPVQQLRLARHLLPGAQHAGVLLGTTDPVMLESLRAEAGRLRLKVVISVLDPEDFPVRRLNKVLDDSDFLLAIEDPAVFSPGAAKTTLLTSYRHGKPVLGPSGAYVDAGSIASLVVTLPDVVDTLATWLPSLLAVAGELPPPRYATPSSIKTNPQVARSLRLLLPLPDRLPQLLDNVIGGMP